MMDDGNHVNREFKRIGKEETGYINPLSIPHSTFSLHRYSVLGSTTKNRLRSGTCASEGWGVQNVRARFCMFCT
jgi:hypothetical protein